MSDEAYDAPAFGVNLATARRTARESSSTFEVSRGRAEFIASARAAPGADTVEDGAGFVPLHIERG